jgi:hypothetical protein
MILSLWTIASLRPGSPNRSSESNGSAGSLTTWALDPQYEECWTASLTRG